MIWIYQGLFISNNFDNQYIVKVVVVNISMILRMSNKQILYGDFALKLLLAFSDIFSSNTDFI